MREINWAEPFDKPLSGAAKGVLATMMCLPESDYLTAEELYSHFKADPPMVIDDAIAELMSEDKKLLICVNTQMIEHTYPPTPRARGDDVFTANFYADNMRKALSAECSWAPES